MKYFQITLVMLILISATNMIPGIYAEDDDNESEDNGLMQREQEREQEREQDEDENNIPLGSSTGNLILYGTIAAIVASIGYTAFKIMASKRRANKTAK